MSSIQLAWWMQQKTQGDDAFKAGNYSDAINHYSSALRTKAIQGDPAECAKIHCNRCLAFQYAQQWNYAVEDALLAIQLQPNWFKGWYRLGSALLGCNRFEEAQLAFETALKLNRRNAELQRRLEFSKVQAERGKDQATAERLQPKAISYNVVDFITQHAALIEPVPEEEEEVKPAADEYPAENSTEYGNGYHDGRPEHMPPYDYYSGYPPPPGYGDYPGMRPGQMPMPAWSGPGYPYMPMGPPPGYFGPPGDVPPPPPEWDSHRYPYYPVPPHGYYQPPMAYSGPGSKVPPSHHGIGSPPGSPSFSGKSNEDKAERYRLSGNGYYSDGRYQDAYAAYCKATEYNPRVASYYANRGAAAMMLKKYWVTVDDCMKAIEVDPNYIRGYSRAAKAHLCLGNFDKAISLYNAALGKEPHSTEIRDEKMTAEKSRECYFKARESMVTGRTRLALEFAQLALESTSMAIEPVMKIKCEALMALGRVEDATEVAKDITIDGDANHPEVSTLNGKVHYVGGNMEAAQQLLEEAVRAQPSETSPAAVLLKKIKIQMSAKAAGNSSFKDGKWQDAIMHYTKALEADPQLRTNFIAQCATNRATALLKLDRNDEAIKDCNFALFIDQNSIKAYMRRAQAYLNLKQIEAAIKDLERVKEMDADYPGLKEMMADAKRELRRNRREVDYYEVLGVPGDASEQEIKKSYKKLALKFHPDKVKEGDDREHAEKMFKLIGEAHALLTDTDKRSKYDAGWTLEEIENAENGEGEMSMEEMFAQMFGSDYFKQGEKDFEAFVKEFSKSEFKDKNKPVPKPSETAAS